MDISLRLRPRLSLDLSDPDPGGRIVGSEVHYRSHVLQRLECGKWPEQANVVGLSKGFRLRGNTLKFTQLAFRAGASLEAAPLVIQPKRVTLFIGPNNGGKSRALAELQQALSPITNFAHVIFGEIGCSEITEHELVEMLAPLQRPKRPGEDASLEAIALEGRGGRTVTNRSVLESAIKPGANLNLRQYLAQHLLRFFYLHLGGEGRLNLANPVSAQPVGSISTNTVSSVFEDDVLRARLSNVVLKAFGQYLVVDPTQLPNIGYRLSSEPAEGGIEKRLDADAAAFFAKAMPISDASDGTRAFVGILAEVMAGDPHLLFIDEPEAFLHPSLQFLLGQQISLNITDEKQIYIATHSPSFLLGCILSGTDVDVVRLTHKGGTSTARHLSADRIRILMTDPLMRSVGAANALFHESAVVVEGDSDRAFYDEINARMHRFSDRGIPHVAFLNAHNKQTAVNIVKPLREIGIPAASILDIDWIKEDGQVWDRYFAAMGAPLTLKESMAAARRAIRSALETADPNYKRAGGVSLLQGAERQAADAFFDQVEQYGTFTVRSGELESWLPALQVERTKSKWLVSMFKAMGSNAEDSMYLTPGADDVWAFIDRIAAWTANPNRYGMIAGS